MKSRKAYWFPARTYGWGWGIPNSWQGWSVVIAYLVGVVAAVVFVAPEECPIEFGAILGALTIALLVVCWLKGEPPRWRWGRK